MSTPESSTATITPDVVGRMVMLAYGVMSNSEPFWCYVAVKPTQYDHVKKIAKTLDIRNFEKEGYGEIIVSGEGLLPPSDVTKQVAAMFGVSIRQLFADIDPNDAIGKEMDRLIREAGHS
jgi:hypothetical protein